MKYRHSICWIRRDLRLADNHALSAAKQNSEFVTVVFVFDTNILDKLKNKNDRRLTFIHQSLQEVHSKLQSKGSQLVILKGNPEFEIPNVARLLKADAVYANHDYEPYAKMRDKKVYDALQEMGCFFHLFKDQVIFAGLEVKKKSGEPFRVYTPYKNQWLEQLEYKDAANHTIQHENYINHSKLKAFSHDWTLKDLGFEKNTLWIDGGETVARHRLRNFSANMDRYHENRDFPWNEKGTSGLSVHLRFGTISIRSCVRAAQQKKSEGAKVWLNELIWRDFYHMILDQFPHVAKESFKPEYASLTWPGSDENFKKWTEGQTGYPIVDAAMRCFSETGWMHNRLRMITAMFLCKDLLVDWRKGEEYFAQHLLDYDQASNNGGWQWCASTGCDSQPYFRIFNPTLQSEIFDANGDFIRRYCPELQNFSDKQIHAPWLTSSEEQKKAKCVIGKNYPAPIVDHAKQREKVLRLFKKNP